MLQTLQRIVASKEFNYFILALIVLSGILVGLETYPQFGEHTEVGRALLRVQDIILYIFIVEAAMKIAACGRKPWKYFQNPWNVFDFAIISVCFFIDADYAMVFRMARLLRALRLLTTLPRLQVLVNALLKSIPSLGYVALLLLLHFYIYAVMGTFVFRDNDPMRFGNLERSMMTLFQVLTLEGWNDVLNTQVLGSDVTYDQEWRDHAFSVARESQAQPVFAALYFVSFILLGTMIMLNLFTGVIISSMQEAQEQRNDDLHAQEKAEQTENQRIEEIEKKGFMTLREEFEVIAHHLREVSTDIAALKEQTVQLRLGQVATDGAAAAEALDPHIRAGNGKDA